jgi:hypothetical protein
MIWEGNDSFSSKRPSRKALAQQAVISWQLKTVSSSSSWLRFRGCWLLLNQLKYYSNCTFAPSILDENIKTFNSSTGVLHLD